MTRTMSGDDAGDGSSKMYVPAVSATPGSATGRENVRYCVRLNSAPAACIDPTVTVPTTSAASAVMRSVRVNMIVSVLSEVSVIAREGLQQDGRHGKTTARQIDATIRPYDLLCGM